MNTFSGKEKRATPTRHSRPASEFNPNGPTNKGQQDEIRRILRFSGAQARLTVSQPNDEYEQEADRVAGQVMAMRDVQAQGAEQGMTQPPKVQRSCPDCEEELAQRQPEEEEEEEILQAKEQTGRTPEIPPDLEIGIRALQGRGRPLSESERSFFEPRFGADFSNVRLHADTQAADVARSINARAFTLGRDVVLGNGEAATDTSAGKELLAHELTHVVQQNNPSTLSPTSVIRREPYETRGIDLDRTQIDSMAGESYWEQRTFRAFDTSVDRRMQQDAEERDAVLAAFWASNPSTQVRSQRIQYLPVATRNLPVPAGEAAQTAEQLMYKVTFQPPEAGQTKPRLELEFVASGAAAAAPSVVSPAPDTFQPADPDRVSYRGFPGPIDTALDDYWAAHPDEHRAVFQYIQGTADASFDAVIEATTSETVRRRTRVTHRSVFHIVGQHTGDTVNRLNITLLNEGDYTTSPQQTVPADYRGRTTGDLEIENLQGRSTSAGRLGSVTLPADLPDDERLPVQYAIWQYFAAGNARNTEVDAIVPVGSSRNVLFTLIFGADNNVTVTRIGEAGSGTGQIDLNRISVTRINGFPGATATDQALRTWWTTRYPQGGTLPAPPAPAAAPDTPDAAPATPDTAALITAMDQLITTGITNAAWFQQNYGIEVLDSTALATRLETVHSVPTDMTTDTVNFSATDLRMLELALQTLPASELLRLRGVNMGRKTSSITRNGTNYAAASDTTYGLTLLDQTGSTPDVTVLYFQSLYMNNTSLFRGSTADNVLPDVTMGMLHELGHATEYTTPAIETAFNAWLSRHRQTAPTWYAASASDEFFPEAWALYHTDPRFLCNSSPQLYAWFHHLATTGTPAAANTTFPAPTCP